MAVFYAFKIQNDLNFAGIGYYTFSGVITDGANPVRRKIIAYRLPFMNNPLITFSDSITGAWSLSASANPTDRFIFVAISDNQFENSQIFDWVAPS